MSALRHTARRVAANVRREREREAAAAARRAQAERVRTTHAARLPRR